MAPLLSAVGTVFAYVVVFVVMVVPLALWYSYAASVLWAWFVAPVFGLPDLPVTHMWGLMMFLALLRYRMDTNVKDPSKTWEAFGFMVIAPAITLGVGWVVKTYFW